MKIGFGLPVAGVWSTPEALSRFARRAEDLGYDSLWTFQRLLVPEDGEVDPVYRSVLDPLVALAYAAARTNLIRLGVALVNMPFVAPVYLAKQAATLDVLSGGRLDLGLGIGWSPIEFAATGASRERRGARAEEYLAVLRTLWADEVSEFAGEFYTVPRGRVLPKPAQWPGPPVLLGGSAPAALARAGRLADGWMSRSATDLTRIASEIAAVRAVCRGVVRFDERGLGTPGPGGTRLRLSGSADQIREDAEWLAEQGVTELFYDLNWDPLIGDPAADPIDAAVRAERIQYALAPAV